MKKTLLVSFVSAASAVALVAANPDPAQLQGFPKNLARQHVGANLFQYSAATQAYAPTQAAAAWLDDDITTGWAMLSGKQYYLIAFPEAELITNFSLSGRPTTGAVSLYAGEEPAPPGAKSWTTLAKDMPFESLNEKKLGKTFSRTAKYLLIETDLADPGPIYSLYVYGEQPAVSYEIRNREQPISTRSIFGPYANDTTAFSVTSLYAHSYVQPQEGQSSVTELQKAIDDNPETFATVGGAQSPLLEIHSQESRSISRVAMEVNPGAKGRFEFFLKTDDATAAPDAAPVATLVFDGSTSRSSVDFSPVQGSILQARWTPANGSDSVSVHEINAFSNQSLALNTVSSDFTPPSVADGTDTDTQRRRARSTRDGKQIASNGKESKDIEPIAALEQGPYLPGSLGFPPNLAIKRMVLAPPGQPPTPTPPTPVLPPDVPVSN